MTISGTIIGTKTKRDAGGGNGSLASAFRHASWRFCTGRIWLGGLAALALCLPGCANKKAKPAPVNIVWPNPPEEPRIAYVASVTQPSDLGLKRSGWNRVANWLIGAQRGNEQFVKPFGLAVDEADNLCVTDTGAGAVCFFDLGQKRLHRWTGAGKIRFATPVAVAKRGGTVFVADSARASVIALSLKGALLFELTNGVQRPVGLAASETNLYVVDSQLNRVAIYDFRGTLIRRFGKRGAGPGEFNFPTHVAVDRRGYLLVTDAMNGRVQVFDLEGNYQGRIGSPGDSSGHFGRPKGIAADSFGRVYVMDGLFDNLQIFERDGRLLLSLGETGGKAGEFWLPGGIAITQDNRIFIADSYNRRVQILKYIGAP